MERGCSYSVCGDVAGKMVISVFTGVGGAFLSKNMSRVGGEKMPLENTQITDFLSPSAKELPLRQSLLPNIFIQSYSEDCLQLFMT